MGPDEMVDINTLEMIQRPQAQFVKTDTKVDLVLLKYVLQNLQWTSLQDRRNISHTTLLYKIVNNQVAINKSESLLPNLHLSCHTTAHSCPTYASHVTQQSTPAQPTPLMSHHSPLLPNLHLSRHTTAHSCPTYTSDVTQQPTPARLRTASPATDISPSSPEPWRNGMFSLPAHAVAVGTVDAFKAQLTTLLSKAYTYIYVSFVFLRHLAVMFSLLDMASVW